MIPTTAYVKVGPDGLAAVDASLRISASSDFQCCLYEDRPPILSIDDAQASVSISVPDPHHVTPEDVATVRRLATELDRYITDLERWATTHATQHPAAGSEAA